jgi:hypothetical protein
MGIADLDEPGKKQIDQNEKRSKNQKHQNSGEI